MNDPQDHRLGDSRKTPGVVGSEFADGDIRIDAHALEHIAEPHLVPVKKAGFLDQGHPLAVQDQFLGEQHVLAVGDVGEAEAQQDVPPDARSAVVEIGQAPAHVGGQVLPAEARERFDGVIVGFVPAVVQKRVDRVVPGGIDLADPVGGGRFSFAHRPRSDFSGMRCRREECRR